jgi:hypothetical protein
LAAVKGEETLAGLAQQFDVKKLHAQIWKLALENDFGPAARQGRTSEHQAMIDARTFCH